jgi:hypothetical protein
VGNTEDYVKRARIRYSQATTKRAKGQILTEVCQVLQCHRKSAIRLLNRADAEPKRRPGRPQIYTALVIAALRTAWEATDEACGKRLAPQLPTLVDVLTRHGELPGDDLIQTKLAEISPATIDRRLRATRLQLPRRPFHQSRAVATIQRQVPIRTFGDWADATPGQVQIDLVAHCGVNAAGAFLVTLTMVDVATGWTECYAALSKHKERIQGAVEIERRQLPFPLRSIHTDNGGEFLNEALYSYCQQKAIAFTRGRAYKKNDQAWVEQKNGAVVRRFVGYYRYQSTLAKARLNALYELLRLYVNFFLPVRRLVEKERDGAKVIKRYDDAATPYQRLLAADVLDEPTRKRLEVQYQVLNPVKLRAWIVEAIREVMTLAVPRFGSEEDGGGKVDSRQPAAAGEAGLPTFLPPDADPTPAPAPAATGVR